MQMTEQQVGGAALLLMDYQVGVLTQYAAGAPDALPAAQAAVEAARKAGVPVIHVVVGFRPGAPEVAADHAAFGPLKTAGRLEPGPMLEIHPALRPLDGEVVVTKHRVGAFLGTDLDMILRAQQVRTLVLAGVATSGVVLSTVRYAADADYRLVVLSDACADGDPQVHACLVERVFPRQATVMTAAEYARSLSG